MLGSFPFRIFVKPALALVALALVAGTFVGAIAVTIATDPATAPQRAVQEVFAKKIKNGETYHWRSEYHGHDLTAKPTLNGPKVDKIEMIATKN